MREKMKRLAEGLSNAEEEGEENISDEAPFGSISYTAPV